jgi:hypothetical protein
MRIVLLILFTVSLPAFSSIDRTRLQMELDYLLEEARDIELNEKGQTDRKQVANKDLKFKRSANQSDILSLEDEFDSVKAQYSAPKRKENFIESKIEKKPVRMDGLVPKDLFEEKKLKD